MGIIEAIRDRARFYNRPVCGRSLKTATSGPMKRAFHLQVTCAQCQVTFIVVLAIAGGAVEEPRRLFLSRSRSSQPNRSR
jgi:hypothetical protein